jgi:hypothetical protein
VEEEITKGGIYPNPVNDVLYMDGFHSGARYLVVGMIGELEATGVGRQVDVSQLPSGMHILVIGKEHFKFIKQ